MDKYRAICINLRILSPQHGEPPAHPHSRVSADRNAPAWETLAKEAVWLGPEFYRGHELFAPGWSLDQWQGIGAAYLSTHTLVLFCPAKQEKAFSLGVTANPGRWKENASSQWDRPFLLRTKHGCEGDFCPGKDRRGGESNVNDTQGNGFWADP